jgi:cytochrome c oxidase assembly protein subunit 15
VLGLVHLVSLQATLGISTLIYMVPTWLASAHQAGALALLSGAVLLYSRISMPRRAILRQVMKPHAPRSSTTPPIRSRLEAAPAERK